MGVAAGAHSARPARIGKLTITRRFSSQSRKPYTISKQRERWSEEEHQRFVEAVKTYGRQWRKIEGEQYLLAGTMLTSSWWARGSLHSFCFCRAHRLQDSSADTKPCAEVLQQAGEEEGGRRDARQRCASNSTSGRAGTLQENMLRRCVDCWYWCILLRPAACSDSVQLLPVQERSTCSVAESAAQTVQSCTIMGT